MRHRLESGIEYEDLKISGGPIVHEGDIVNLLYRVARSEDDLAQGRILEQRGDHQTPLEIVVDRNELLSGVFEGLLGMRAGGSIRRLFIPAHRAFGDLGWGPVRPGESLVIELVTSLVRRP